MKRYFLVIAIALLIVNSGCKSRQLSGKKSNDEVPGTIAGLKVKISPATTLLTKDSLLITFKVINETDQPLRFVKWETPFDPKLGKYFDVIASDGSQAEFKGAMARRVMPPPAEAYQMVEPHKSLSTVINLSDKYHITSDRYQIIYTGSGISGLKKPQDLSVSVKE